MDTLAFGYILPTTGQIWDFNPLETCAARRTKKSPGGIAPAGGYANSRPHTCLNTNNYEFIKPFRHCQVH